MWCHVIGLLAQDIDNVVGSVMNIVEGHLVNHLKRKILFTLTFLWLNLNWRICNEAMPIRFNIRKCLLSWTPKRHILWLYWTTCLIKQWQSKFNYIHNWHVHLFDHLKRKRIFTMTLLWLLHLNSNSITWNARHVHFAIPYWNWHNGQNNVSYVYGVGN
jgi:hypothetical protein